MTDEQKKKAVSALAPFVKRPCPMCGKNAGWQLLDTVAAPIFSGGTVLVGPLYPLVAVACQSCWFTAHFAAVPHGIVAGGDKGA
jgi:hypothetical protein